MFPGREGSEVRWRFYVSGLPLLALVMLAGYRVSTDTWRDAVQETATSPYMLLAMFGFGVYTLGREAPTRTMRRAWWWLGSGVIGCVSAVSVEVLPVSWIEAVLDGLLVIFGAISLGDGFRTIGDRLSSLTRRDRQ